MLGDAEVVKYHYYFIIWLFFFWDMENICSFLLLLEQITTRLSALKQHRFILLQFWRSGIQKWVSGLNETDGRAVFLL